MTTDIADIETIQTVLAKADLLHDEEAVQTALDEMAAAMNEQIQLQQPLLCLSVMLGGLVPTGQLITRLSLPLELEYIHATRYRNTTEGHELDWKKYPSQDLAGRTVLIIDDILDEGLTLEAIVKYCQTAGAKQVYTAVLVEKQLNKPRPGLAKADFVGLVVPDRYVFGFGMDYQGQLRYVPCIYAVDGL